MIAVTSHNQTYVYTGTITVTSTTSATGEDIWEEENTYTVSNIRTTPDIQVDTTEDSKTPDTPEEIHSDPKFQTRLGWEPLTEQKRKEAHQKPPPPHPAIERGDVNRLARSDG